MTEPKDTPGVIAPPPIIFFGLWLLGLALNFFSPQPWLPDGLRWIVGVPLVGVGLLLGLWAFQTFRRAHTPTNPYESPTAIATDGPYRFTRNPIYLGFALMYLGLTCLFNSLWPLPLLLLALFIVDRGVIAREERYLEHKFGATYLKYKMTVRRWI